MIYHKSWASAVIQIKPSKAYRPISLLLLFNKSTNTSRLYYPVKCFVDLCILPPKYRALGFKYQSISRLQDWMIL